MSEQAMMSLSEALGTEKNLKERIEKAIAKIEGYASLPATARPLFDTEDMQKKEVMSLIQSVKDLEIQWRTIKLRIELTNLNTRVTIIGREFYLSELLQYERHGHAFLQRSLDSLNRRYAMRALGARSHRDTPTDDKICVFFTEQFKNNRTTAVNEILDEWRTKRDHINATTELLTAVQATEV